MIRNIQAVAGVVLREMLRRKDFYVVLVLSFLLVGLMAASRFFSADKAVASLKDAALLIIWISAFVIAVTSAARQIPAECESGTIFPLLAKPITRTEVLLGKFMGCWLACGVALAVFYAFLTIFSASRAHTMPGAIFFQAFWAHWILLGLIISLALLGSLVFAAPSSNTTICLVALAGLWLLGGHLNHIALRMTEPGSTLVYILYYILPHVELFDLRRLVVHDYPAVPWLMWAAQTLYGLTYTAALLVIGCTLFQRKSLR